MKLKQEAENKKKAEILAQQQAKEKAEAEKRHKE